MTDEEALESGGLTVEVKVGRVWRRAVVSLVCDRRFVDGHGNPRGAVELQCRRIGTDTRGRCFGLGMARRASEVKLVPDLDPPTANVFADYLDDHGEHRAAALLRQAFPRVDAEGNTT